RDFHVTGVQTCALPIFFGGLGVAEINQSNGMLLGSVNHIYGGTHQSIEAPYITRNGDYYYLFMNRGSCCQGSNSSYYVTVARSRSEERRVGKGCSCQW